MSTVIESVDVDVPVTTAYNQWTQFETFPQFMSGVESIRQVDDTHTHWTTSIDGVERKFDTEITEQHPDERIAWKSTDGTTHAGVVTFHRIGDGQTRVTRADRVAARKRGREGRRRHRRGRPAREVRPAAVQEVHRASGVGDRRLAWGRAAAVLIRDLPPAGRSGLSAACGPIGSVAACGPIGFVSRVRR